MPTQKSAQYTFKNFTELTEQETGEVLQGRNDPEVRRWMTTDRLIAEDEHRSFVSDLRTSSSKIYLRVARAGRFAGVYSVTELVGETGVGGFWVTEYTRRNLLTLSVIFHSVGHVFRRLGIRELRGFQLQDNRAVSRLNALLGFTLVAPPAGSDPRMQFLTLAREHWESSVLSSPKLNRLIAIAEEANED